MFRNQKTGLSLDERAINRALKKVKRNMEVHKVPLMTNYKCKENRETSRMTYQLVYKENYTLIYMTRLVG